MIDVLDEFCQGERLQPTTIHRLVEQGVPARLLGDTWAGIYPLLQEDRVRFDDSNGFEFARQLPRADPAEIVPALTFVLFNDEGQPVDLGASGRGHDVALWRGAVWALGQERIGCPRMGEPLRVFGSVLEWLCAGRDGLVILNHSAAAWELCSAGTLAVGSHQEATRLRKLLTVAAPPIKVSRFVPIDPDLHAELHGEVA